MKRISIFALYLSILLPVVQAQTTIVLQPDSTTGKDTYVHGLQGLTNTNFGSDYQFIATSWTFNSVPGTVRGLIEFDLSVIPANATLISAHLSLYAWDMINGMGFGQHSSLSGSNACWLERVIAPWSEMTATWNNQPATTQINRVALPASTSPTQDYLNINVTQLIQDMISIPVNNHGMMMKLNTESHYRMMNFCSSDHPIAAKRPKLVIVYNAGGIGPCPSYSFHEHHICLRDSIFIQGAYQTAEGIYFDTLVNSLNHDSIVVTALYVSDPVISSISVYICDGDSLFIDGAWRKQAGVYSEYFTSQYGCDSIVHTVLNVTIIHNTVSISGSTLTSNQPNATYQWFDCNGHVQVSGATQQSFQPTANGNYAVMVTKDGCVALSPCVAVTNLKVQNPPGGDHGVKVFPNPTTGRLNLELDKNYNYVNVSAVSMKGSTLLSSGLNNARSHELDLSSLPKGLYLLNFILDNKSFTMPLVLE